MPERSLTGPDIRSDNCINFQQRAGRIFGLLKRPPRTEAVTLMAEDRQ